MAKQERAILTFIESARTLGMSTEGLIHEVAIFYHTWRAGQYDEATAWCDENTQAGMWNVYNRLTAMPVVRSTDSKIEHYPQNRFVFTDANVALEFKLRFCPAQP